MDINDPNIVNLMISSILDNSEDWIIRMVTGDPVIHRHKTGIEIWSYSGDIKFWNPEYAKSVQISEEEKRLLISAIENDRTKKEEKIRKEAAERLIRQFTKPEPMSWLRKLFS